MNFTGKVVLITGAASGMGAASARQFAALGARVVVVDCDADLAKKVASEIGADPPVIGDVSDSAFCRQVVESTMEKHGRLDVLVNCAGIIVRKPIEEIIDTEWDSIMDVNLRGVFLCSQVVGREMIKRKQGKIINISSNIAQVLQPHRGAYAVSKAGVSHLTKVMALEWAAYHINVNAIAPAPTMTDLNKKYFDEHPEDLKERLRSIPMGRLGDPQDYVGAAIFLASRASDFVTGQTVFVDGGSILI